MGGRDDGFKLSPEGLTQSEKQLLDNWISAWCSRIIKSTGLNRAHSRFTETLDAPAAVVELIEREAEAKPLAKPQVNLGGIEEVVADKGYHSGPTLQQMRATGVRTYIPEKKQAGNRHWESKEDQWRLVYANRQRLQRPKGQATGAEARRADRANIRPLLRHRRHAA
jgi:hypothetical protein